MGFFFPIQSSSAKYKNLMGKKPIQTVVVITRSFGGGGKTPPGFKPKSGFCLAGLDCWAW